jgi:hypothetical protein
LSVIFEKNTGAARVNFFPIPPLNYLYLKAVYQEDEILAKIREFYPKFLEVMPEEDIIRTDFDFGSVNNHRADYLAEGILRCAYLDAELMELASQLPPKVQCSFPE